MLNLSFVNQPFSRRHSVSFTASDFKQFGESFGGGGGGGEGRETFYKPCHCRTFITMVMEQFDSSPVGNPKSSSSLDSCTQSSASFLPSSDQNHDKTYYKLLKLLHLSLLLYFYLILSLQLHKTIFRHVIHNQSHHYYIM